MTQEQAQAFRRVVVVHMGLGKASVPQGTEAEAL